MLTVQQSHIYIFAFDKTGINDNTYLTRDISLGSKALTNYPLFFVSL